MRRWMTALLALLLLALPCAVAMADIPWEPYDDFRDRHDKDCENSYRNYIAAEDIEVWTDPETPTVLWTIEEGEDVYTYCTYKDDRRILWGMIATREYGDVGWVPLGLTLYPDGSPVDGGPVHKLAAGDAADKAPFVLGSVWMWAAGAVALVAIVTAVTLALVFRRKREE